MAFYATIKIKGPPHLQRYKIGDMENTFLICPFNKSQATHFMEINKDDHQVPIQVQVRTDNQVTVGQLPGFGHCTRVM